MAIVMLAVLLLATPGLVAARGGHGGGGQGGTWFNLYGQIYGAPDDDARTFVVDVDSPDSLPEYVTVKVTDETHLKLCGVVGEQIDFADLDDEDWVRVVGVVEGGTYIATRVILYE